MSDSSVTQAAEAAAGVADGALPGNRVLLILTADHRDSLERDLYGLTAPANASLSGPDQRRQAAGLPGAARRRSTASRPDPAGVLIDEQYGASVAELASRSAGAVTLRMLLEASGREWFGHVACGGWSSAGVARECGTESDTVGQVRSSMRG